MSDNETIVITGADNIEAARVLAVRSALKLEVMGMKRYGRSARVLANEITGLNCRTAAVAYVALNTYIVETYGQQFDRPMS